ncbi:MAG: hypothetical protein L0H79_04820 [Intrasporangium sp.]|uniref:hypothetical protein n=1 Tax=Intrasporangium sp. TaxID=1925024 RepID=UPI002648A839|nr:hypothetical protein [Intrasporangium sp.]MDN5795057.1 hypothetical protein [Intrasporangium sp.]
MVRDDVKEAIRMLVDCDTCPVRKVRCAECLVTALGHLPVQSGAPVWSGPEAAAAAKGLPLDRAERRAVSALVSAGLVRSETARAARAVQDPRPPRARAGHRRAAG